MFKIFFDWIVGRLLIAGSKHRFLHVAIFTVFMLPVLAIAFFSYLELRQHAFESGSARRESIAYLGATILKEKFDGLVNLGVSLATRVAMRRFISEGKWDEAVKLVQDVPRDFLYLDNIVLFDTEGTAKELVVPTIPDVRGQSFAHRDYYKGVSKEWKPYVSEIFKKSVEPKDNIIAIAIPIKSDAPLASDQKILGILLLTIKLDTILDWARQVQVGEGGFLYFVDRSGHVAGHPKFSSQAEVVDFSSVPVVRAVLRGEQGVGVFYNPVENEERLSAYAPLSGYGWGAIVQQPTHMVSAEHDYLLGSLLIIYAFILLFNVFIAYVLTGVLHVLNEYRQRENVFLNSIGDGLVAIDRAWNIMLFNKSASEISGFAQQEALGKPLRSVLRFIRESDRKENITFIEDALVLGKTSFMEDHTVLVRKDGREVSVGDSASPIIDKKGKVSGAIIIFRDTTQEKEAQMLRSDFAYASHQLRTPITKVLWSLETAVASKGEKAIREHVKTSYQSMKSVEKLIEQLLIVSEIDQKTIIPKIDVVKLTDLFDALLAMIDKKEKGHRTKITISPISAVASMPIDKKLLSRVLFEIVENAMHYSPAKSEVRVDVRFQEKELLIEVHDAGIGIPSVQRPLIFTKFFRGSNIAPDSVGAGLGLFIAREYTKLLGGKIWFTSEEKKGTTFSILIPISNHSNTH